MKITFRTDLGEEFEVEINSTMELENVMAFLEAEVRFQSPKPSFCPITAPFAVWDTYP
jgi:hypothetical protein